MNGSWLALGYLLLRLQQITPHASPVGRARQLVVATIGLVLIVALPVIALYYARKRWRP